MAYTVTKRQSYGSRILNSFVGVLIGIALIIGMSILLYWNEGRYNPADLAETAQQITAANAASLDGQLVWYKGTLTGGQMNYTDDVILDSNYLYIQREVEIYAWIESSHTETHDNMGGSQDTTTTYTYALGWTSTPEDPAEFESPEDRNKPKADFHGIGAYEVQNSSITTADFTIDSSALKIDGAAEMPLTPDVTVDSAALNENILINGKYIYFKAEGSTGPSTPSFNDIRVKYTYIPSGLNGVLIGRANGNSIVEFSNEDASLYRFFKASALEEVVATLNSEHKASTWMFRIIGTILMCVGFALLTGPFSTLLMVVPFLGKASNFILGIVSFLIGFVYSFLVIVISAIIHNWIALVIAIGIIVVLVMVGISKKKKRPAKAR